MTTVTALNGAVRASPPLTLFSFGYEGWGSTTKILVDIVDTVERNRGFLEPIFVDARLRRSVRAVGFRDKAFERLLGPERYVWMPGLGNLSILDNGPWRLKDRKGIDELLSLAERAARNRRRIIYFCSCGQPPTRCHRHELISKALIERARAEKLDVAVAEWPGGEPQALEQQFDLKTFRALAAAAKRAPKTGSSPPTVTVKNAARFHGVAWATMLTARVDPSTVVDLLIGPPTASTLGWHLPVLGPASTAASATRLREANGYAALSAGHGGRRWAAASVYTLLHVDKVMAADGASALRFKVNRRMTTAGKLLADARADGTELPVIIGDAVDCSAIVGVARVVEMDLKDDATDLLVADVRALVPRHRQQELTLLSTKQPIAAGFIRPYAIVKTPPWIEKT